MPSVFLSYSREDLTLIEELEAHLHNHSEITIWRDQEKLYGGQKWPRILGEAIGDQDFFLLAWSKNSANSHFVEFEWCTALALKKPIIPCLLDGTKLPLSLAATHAIPVENIQDILTTLTGLIPLRDTNRRAGVISKLDQIRDTKPEDVLAHVKATFGQKHWVVHGNVIQGEHVTVTIAGESKESHKGLLDKWQTWAGLAVTLLTGISLMADLPGKIYALFSNETAPSLGASGEDCAAVLQNVKAGNDITLNIKCDIPTEMQMVSEISKGIWQDKCPYFIPANGWQMHEVNMSNELLLIPNPGHYFSQFNFTFSILPKKLSPNEFVYLYGRSLTKDQFVSIYGINDNGATNDLAELETVRYDLIGEISKMYPSEGAISWEAQNLLNLLFLDQLDDLNKEKKEFEKGSVESLDLRRRLSYEDGEVFDTIKIRIYKSDQTDVVQDGTWIAGVTLLGNVDPYPSWEKAQSGLPQVTDFSCSATIKMNLKTFSALCAMLLEKHSLAPRSCSEAHTEEEVVTSDF